LIANQKTYRKTENHCRRTKRTKDVIHCSAKGKSLILAYYTPEGKKGIAGGGGRKMSQTETPPGEKIHVSPQ